ncbi:ankyrin repeat domain-containing protein [Aneurinibacillus tyrosinisolvens]|uniref:ankyrin repeat domain-containing protein n=1 Tax=Aneurinibacillus tyrosinisolvens TaxID=1443435 RepID=UPI00063FB372|nr:ankyrin repeat domain-containing protein [Aneurinibacillus tyrosinisolvens]
MGVTDNASIFTIAQHGDFDTFIKKFDKSDINKKSEAGSSLLHHAIAGRNFDIALFLIQNNIDVNITNIDGQTPLHLICIHPNLEVAKEILNKGGDINIRDKYGNNALWSAVFNSKGKYYGMVELFMQKTPDLTTKNKAGKSPLDFATQINNEKLIDILKNQ